MPPSDHRRLARKITARLATVGLLGCGPTLGVAQAPGPVRELAGYDAYVLRAMQQWKVPGAAVAIIRHDSVLLAKGYGVRRLGDAAPVDAHTVFAIGSATKAFTGALVARLVDEGVVKWDDPVRAHLPWFEMYDPEVSRDLTIRDLLTHRSGLSPGDNVWYGNSLSRAEVVRRLRYFKPSWPFRARFGYQNAMFIAAGLVVEARRGYPWDDAIRRELFAPLGMTESHTTNHDLEAISNRATPHALWNDTVHVIAYRNIDNAGPAGSITSTVTDMAKWVRFQLDSGKAGGTSVVTPASIAESHTPQTVIRREGPWAHVNPFSHFDSYGLGWFLHDFRGREVVEHGGNIDGMSAMVGLMPEEGVGVVILTNLNQTVLVDALLWYTLDCFLTASPPDWSADLARVAARISAETKTAVARRLASRVADTKPSLPLERYAGIYRDSLYGEARVTVEEGRLVARYGAAFVGDLTHWHYDTFQATWRDPMLGRGLVTFALDRSGGVERMSIERLTEFVRAEPDRRGTGQ
jgi:CubicO group peptidase (beta-lactamase class C family)